MLIAYSAVIDTGTDQSVIGTGDASDVGNGGCIFSGKDIGESCFHIDGRKVDVIAGSNGIHITVVSTVRNTSMVVAGNAADQMAAIDGAGGDTVCDHSRGFIQSDDQSGFAAPIDVAVSIAVTDDPIVAACNQAKAGMSAFGLQHAPYGKIINLPILLDIAEQAGIIAAGGQGKAGNAMALSQEDAAEGRDGRKISAGKVDVIVQHKKLSL